MPRRSGRLCHEHATGLNLKLCQKPRCNHDWKGAVPGEAEGAVGGGSTRAHLLEGREEGLPRILCHLLQGLRQHLLCASALTRKLVYAGVTPRRDSLRKVAEPVFGRDARTAKAEQSGTQGLALFVLLQCCPHPLR